MSVCGAASVHQLQETKTKKCLNMINSLQMEGVDSSFDMQNGLTGNLLRGSHKPVCDARARPSFLQGQSPRWRKPR